MSVSTRPMTADEFLHAQFEPGTRHELIRGEVRELAVPARKHGRVAMKAGRRIGDVVDAHNLGEVYAAQTGFAIEHNPDTVRCPDVSSLRSDRLAASDEEKFLPFAPDLAVEVISLGDRPDEVAEKT